MPEILTPIKAIRAKCLDCVGYDKGEVRKCDDKRCSLWPYRMGHNPNRKGIFGGKEGLRTRDSFHERCYTMLKTAFKKKGFDVPENFEEIVGMPIEDFVEYLLCTWIETYGYEWDREELAHIDHIVPLATAKTYSDVVKLNHYTNLRLIRATDNLRKGAKLDYTIPSISEA